MHRSSTGKRRKNDRTTVDDDDEINSHMNLHKSQKLSSRARRHLSRSDTARPDNDFIVMDDRSDTDDDYVDDSISSSPLRNDSENDTDDEDHQQYCANLRSSRRSNTEQLASEPSTPSRRRSSLFSESTSISDIDDGDLSSLDSQEWTSNKSGAVNGRERSSSQKAGVDTEQRGSSKLSSIAEGSNANKDAKLDTNGSESRRKRGHGTNPNKPDKMGRTKIFGATRAGHLDKVKELVKQGANVNHRDNAGWTPLHEAALKGQYEIAKYLVSCHAMVNARGFGDDTPLHDACSNGFADCVQLLVDSGANVFALNKENQQPLDVCEDTACSNILKKRISQLNHLTARDDNGRTILHRACVGGNHDEVARLVDQGANVNIQNASGWAPMHDAATNGHLTIVKFLADHGALINMTDSRGDTPLHCASRNGHQDVVQYLLEAGADVKKVNNEGKTAYDIAGSVTIRQVLTAKMDEERKQQQTVDIVNNAAKYTVEIPHLYGTVASASEDTKRTLSREERKVQSYMKAFAHLETKPKRGRGKVTDDNDYYEQQDPDLLPLLPLPRKRRRATRRKHGSRDESREASLDRDVRSETPKSRPDVGKLNVHKKDTSGRTQLHKWAVRGDVEIVQQLLEKGANPNEVDNAGWTPLHEAALRGHLEVVEVLLDNGANANAQSADLDTPLHDATENRHPEIVKLLLGRGADVHITNTKGDNALDIAIEMGFDDIEQVIRSFILKQASQSRRQRKSGRMKQNSHEDVMVTGTANATVTGNTPDTKDITDSSKYMQASLSPKPVKRRRLVRASSLEAETVVSDHDKCDVPIKLEKPVEDVSVMDRYSASNDDELANAPESSLQKRCITNTDPSVRSPNTPIPTPPPEKHVMEAIVKEESEGDDLISILRTNAEDHSYFSEPIHFLPLYTVQLTDNNAASTSTFYVLDLQVSLFMGLCMSSFWKRYSYLHRRAVTIREKTQFWSPLSAILCRTLNPTIPSHAALKARVKRIFLDTQLSFIRLDAVTSLIRRDYSHLIGNIITINLDMTYQDSTAASTPSASFSHADSMIQPNLPPKIAMKLRKCNMIKFNQPSRD